MIEMPTIAILAGGLATRMRPLTDDCPKALIPVAGEAFAAHQLKLLAANGFKSVVFLIGHLGEQIVETIGNGEAFGLDVSYKSDGPYLLGTGGSLASALPMLGDPFCTIYGDSWLDFDYAGAVQRFRQAAMPALMTVIDGSRGSEAPNVDYCDGIIRRYDKADPSPEMQHIDYGFGIYAASVFAGVPADRPTDLASIQSRLAAEGKLAGYETTIPYYEVGSFSGRQALEDHFLGREPGHRERA